MCDDSQNIEIEINLLRDGALSTFDKLDRIVKPHFERPVQRVHVDFKNQIERERGNTSPLTRDGFVELLNLFEKQADYYLGVEASPTILRFGRAAYVDALDVRELDVLKHDLFDLKKRAAELRHWIDSNPWPGA